MTSPATLREIAATLRALRLPDLAARLDDCATIWRRQERALDEIVAEAMEEERRAFPNVVVVNFRSGQITERHTAAGSLPWGWAWPEGVVSVADEEMRGFE